MSGRHPSRDDRALWRRTMRDVTPLAPGRPAPPEKSDDPRVEPARSHRLVPAPVKRAASLPPLAPGDSPGVDHSTAEKFRRGQLAVQARLDLHGMTQEQAHRALVGFIRRGHEDGLRTVLVITDLTAGTGRFNLAGGTVAALSGIAASLSTLLSGFVFQTFGNVVGFLALASAGAAAAALLWAFLAETKPEKYTD